MKVELTKEDISIIYKWFKTYDHLGYSNEIDVAILERLKNEVKELTNAEEDVQNKV